MVEPIGAWIAALIPEPAQARGVRRIARQHRAALAGGHLLVGIEAENSEIAEAAGEAPVEARADGFACILDQSQIDGDRARSLSASICAGTPKV